MIQVSIALLPTGQFLLGYNHEVETAAGEKENYTVHTIQIGILVSILNIVWLKQVK